MIKTTVKQLLLAWCLVFFMGGTVSTAAPSVPAASTPVTGQTTTVTDVAKELVCNCPDCGKQSMDQCVHCEVSSHFRKMIAQQLKQGKTKDQILAGFAKTYGDAILGNPPPVGFNRIAAIMPGIAALLGFGLLGLYWGRRRKRVRRLAVMSTGSPAAVPPAAGPEDPRIAAALREFDN